MATSARRIGNLGALLLGAALIVGLGGCEGDDGDVGPAGPAGPPGSSAGAVSSSAPAALQAEITGVTIASPPVVEFTLADQDGFPFIVSSDVGPLDSSFASFTIAKLIPGSDGDTNAWRSYIEVDDVPGGEVVLQAATDGGGTLVNNGDGSYTYTFETDITAGDVPFDPELTHRVGLEVRGSFRGESLPGVNATFDFVPAGGPVTETRDIVSTETCNECHGRLALHGNGRFDMEHCVTCHNPFSTDEQTGNTVDFRVMIHQIHRGEDLPSVQAGNPLQFAGFGSDNFGAPPDDFSDVAFPQDVRNCTTCHDPANPQTPDAVNFKDAPNIAACGSCHDDVDFVETGDNHPAGVQPNDACTTCHSDTGFVASIPESHTIVEKVAAGRFQYNILGVSSTAPGETPVVQFSVTDPTNGDAPYDVLADPEFDSANGASVNMDVAWNTNAATALDYTNFGDEADPDAGNAPSRPASFSLLDPANVTDNGDGTFTATSTVAIPASATGSGAIGIEGHPAVDIDPSDDADDDGNPANDFVEAPVTGAVEFFAITDTEAQARRDVVDIAKCQTCHGANDGLAVHGNNRTDNIQLCALCHNPNATDIAQRPADADGAVNGVNTAAPDDLEERSIDFKFMIHAIHGSEIRSEALLVRGFFNSNNNFGDLRLPRPASDCQACHNPGTYELPLAGGVPVLGTTAASGATVNTASNFGTSDFIEVFAGSATDPSDDANRSATAAVCAACHDSTVAQSHMEDNGAVFGTVTDITTAGGPADVASRQAVLDGRVESCAVCHGPGAIADVAVEHGID